ncbi:MAG: hypothetical protein JNM22_05555 [Saprospiraceae bacterium]|nr:hypothetical protein [Saprospiraceae bacterium]
MPTIQEIIERTGEAIAQEHDAEMEAQKITSFHWLYAQLPAWKYWWLKRNQPENYFRVTRLVPPGYEKNDFFWKMKFQVWIKGKLTQQYSIDSHTFLYFSTLPGWKIHEDNEMTYATLKPNDVPRANADKKRRYNTCHRLRACGIPVDEVTKSIQIRDENELKSLKPIAAKYVQILREEYGFQLQTYIPYPDQSPLKFRRT